MCFVCGMRSFIWSPFWNLSAIKQNWSKIERLWILDLSKCFNYICSLCTKKGFRHKTPISSVGRRACMLICVSACHGGVSLLSSAPITKHETPAVLFQMGLAFPQAFTSEQLLSQCLMLINDSSTNGHFRNILFVAVYLDTMHFVFSISPLYMSCSK